MFEKKSLQVVVPLDPVEGEHYNELVPDKESDDKLDCIYQITVQDQYRVHSTDGGRISWDRDSTCTVDYDEETKRWQNRLQEVMTLNCNMMIRSL